MSSTGEINGAGMPWLEPSAVLRLYLRRGLALMSVLGLVWLISRVLDFGMVRVRSALEAAEYNVSRSALPLISRMLKILILVLGIVAVLSSWGYNTNTLWAGLGIGGVAIALAAQKTIENLFGSVAVISDRPVMVGDFCKFGDNVGTVEDIGLPLDALPDAGSHAGDGPQRSIFVDDPGEFFQER